MTDSKQLVKDILDRECLEKLQLKPGEYCMHHPTTTIHGRKYHATAPFCWLCRENDKLAGDIDLIYQESRTLDAVGERVNA